MKKLKGSVRAELNGEMRESVDWAIESAVGRVARGVLTDILVGRMAGSTFGGLDMELFHGVQVLMDEIR